LLSQVPGKIPYWAVLEKKLRLSINDPTSKFSVISGIRKSGFNLVFYLKCLHGITMSIMYKKADHQVGQPLTMTWKIKCRYCADPSTNHPSSDAEEASSFKGKMKGTLKDVVDQVVDGYGDLSDQRSQRKFLKERTNFGLKLGIACSEALGAEAAKVQAKGKTKIAPNLEASLNGQIPIAQSTFRSVSEFKLMNSMKLNLNL
jgi:hypothetical protein